MFGYFGFVPSHFLIQKSYLFSEFLAFNVHIFNVYLSPRSCLPIFNACPHDVDVIPKLLYNTMITILAIIISCYF